MHNLSGLARLSLAALVSATLAACGGGQDNPTQSSQLLAQMTSSGGAPLAAGSEMAAVAFAPSLTTAVARTESLLADTEMVHVGLPLRLNNVAELDKLVADLQDPASPRFRQFLTHDEILRRFGPTDAQVAVVKGFLSAKGFSNIKVSREVFMVEADAPAAVASAAFQTKLARYTLADGASAYANKTTVMLPKNLQAVVQGVLGLDTVSQFQTHAIKYTPAARKDGLAATAVAGAVGHKTTEFPGIYGVGSTPAATNVAVAVIAQGKLDQTLADLLLYEQRNGIAPVPTSVVYSGTPSDSVAELAEWNLDSQSIVGMSGGVSKLILYSAPTMGIVDMVGAVGKAVSDNQAKVVSMSFGLCEQVSSGTVNAFNTYFKVGVAQGQTFVASTGDTGSSNPQCSNATSVNMPASSQFVVAVGGTTLQTNSVGGYGSETAWSGSGGGYSTVEGISALQATVVSGSKRALPDIAFAGDPASGALILVNGQEVQYGGTSLSAPLFAATWARMLSQCGNLGNAAPIIYANRNLHTSMFHDVVSGSNGAYSAGAGWDAVTGFGTPSMSNMWSTVCPSGAAYYPVAQHIYFAYLGRPAEPAGLASMASALKSANAPTDVVGLEAVYKTNATVRSLLNNTQGSAESKSVYPTNDTAGYINALHQTLFNRPATAAELSSFGSAVSSGAVPIGDLPLNIMSSMLKAPSDLYAVVDMENRAAAAINFTATLTAASAPYYSGATASTSARHMLQKVTYSSTAGVSNNFTQPAYIAEFQPTINATIAAIVAGVPQ